MDWDLLFRFFIGLLLGLVALVCAVFGIKEFFDGEWLRSGMLILGAIGFFMIAYSFTKE